MTLLLFDIDGTLVTVDDTGRAALTQALSDELGRPITTEGITFSGRTDPDIFRSVLAHNGHEATTEALQAALDAYVAAAQEAIQPSHVRLLPGVGDLLSALADRDDVYLALVTGNVEPIAYHKLAAVGLADYFELGAFGSDHEDRAALPPLAVRRAERLLGRSFPAERVFVIGDTDRDVACARAAGVRSVAVCTGGASRSALVESRPDLLLDDLRDPDQFVTQVVRSA